MYFSCCSFGPFRDHYHSLFPTLPLPLPVMDLFQGALGALLGDIASHYDLDESSLRSRYLGSPGCVKVHPLSPVGLASLPVIAVPPVPQVTVPRPRKGRGKTVEARPSCDYTRDELDGCNVSCLKDLCKHHGLTQGGKKDALISRLLDPESGKPKKRGGKKKKAEKVPEPEHKHAMDGHSHQGCEACENLGNILDPQCDAHEYEVEEAQEAQEVEEVEEVQEVEEAQDVRDSSVDDRLRAIMDDFGEDDSDLEVCSDLSGDEADYMDELCEE